MACSRTALRMVSQLGNLRIALLKPGPQTHGHLQAESGAAGNPQFLKTKHRIGHAGKESQREQVLMLKRPLNSSPMLSSIRGLPSRADISMART